MGFCAGFVPKSGLLVPNLASGSGAETGAAAVGFRVVGAAGAVDGCAVDLDGWVIGVFRYGMQRSPSGRMGTGQ